MNYGLLTIYVLMFTSMLFVAHMHGKPKTDKWNFWSDLAARVLTLVLIWWALGWRIDPFHGVGR